MSATKAKTKKPAKRDTAKKDRHLTPVIVLADGSMLAGKRRIEAHLKKHPDAEVVVSETHHYAMLPFLRVAEDDEGKLRLATQTRIDEEGWEEVQP